MKVGIVGLPNAGKSSLFSALTGVAAEAANYPFTTIEPNIAVHSCTDDNDIGERMLSEKIAADASYQEKAAPIAEKRIAEAGIRLALILNDVATKAGQ